MLELSIFADESGDRSDHAKYYLLTLVFHNQADSIIDQVMTYERSLADADLPNIENDRFGGPRPLRTRRLSWFETRWLMFPVKLTPRSFGELISDSKRYPRKE